MYYRQMPSSATTTQAGFWPGVTLVASSAPTSPTCILGADLHGPEVVHTLAGPNLFTRYGPCPSQDYPLSPGKFLHEQACGRLLLQMAILMPYTHQVGLVHKLLLSRFPATCLSVVDLCVSCCNYVATVPLDMPIGAL